MRPRTGAGDQWEVIAEYDHATPSACRCRIFRVLGTRMDALLPEALSISDFDQDAATTLVLARMEREGTARFCVCNRHGPTWTQLVEDGYRQDPHAPEIWWRDQL